MGKRLEGTALEISRRLQEDFGSRLQQAREARGELQKTLGHRMGLTRTSISNIERGLQRVFLDQVFQAAYILEVDVTQLLPDLEDLFVTQSVMTASDDPLPPQVVEEATRVVQAVTSGPDRRRMQKAEPIVPRKPKRSR